MSLLPITDDEWDPQRTAQAITAAIRDFEAADGPFDLILFGNESADSGGFQVGIRVAYALGRPMVNGAKGLSVDDGAAHVEREADAGRGTYDLPLPAVVGIKEGINLPRYPTMKGRLASKKAEIATRRADRRGRRAREDHPAPATRAKVDRRSSSATGPMRPQPSSTYSKRSESCDGAGYRHSSSSNTTAEHLAPPRSRR